MRKSHSSVQEPFELFSKNLTLFELQITRPISLIHTAFPPQVVEEKKCGSNTEIASSGRSQRTPSENLQKIDSTNYLKNFEQNYRMT